MIRDVVWKFIKIEFLKLKKNFMNIHLKTGIRLNVPGDWNSQSSELKYYEGTVWYGRHFVANLSPDKRQFLYLVQ